MIIKRKKYIYKPQFNYLGFMQRRKKKKLQIQLKGRIKAIEINDEKDYNRS